MPYVAIFASKLPPCHHSCAATDLSSESSTTPWPRIVPTCSCGQCWRLAYSFGFRKSELLTLKVSDVNLLTGTVQLRDSKNGEARKVSLTQDAKSLLAACIAGKSPEDAVFTRGSGNDVKDFRGTWNKITLAAGCEGLLFHDLRRSAVRNRVRAGIPEVVCMKVSGHKTRNVFDRYNITSERDLADAARKVEISYRQAKNEAEQNAEQNAEAEQHATIQ